MITTYTSADEVRAILALSATELPDEQVMLDLYDMRLQEEMDSVSPLVASKFEEVSVVVSPNYNQKRFMSLVKLYASYQLATVVAENYQARALKVISDGRAQGQRFDLDASVLATLPSVLSSFRGKMVEVFNLLYPAEAIAVAVPSQTFASLLTSAVGLASDPITGS